MLLNRLFTNVSYCYSCLVYCQDQETKIFFTHCIYKLNSLTCQQFYHDVGKQFLCKQLLLSFLQITLFLEQHWCQLSERV